MSATAVRSKAAWAMITTHSCFLEDEAVRVKRMFRKMLALYHDHDFLRRGNLFPHCFRTGPADYLPRRD